MAKPALGRGLGALLGGSPVLTQPTPAPAAPVSQPVILSPAPDLHERVQRVPLDRIRPCSLQPRKDFSAEALRELADSIREQGIVQPLIVRERGGHFELIAGERRWRAAQLLQLPEVPIIIRQADDRAVLELALIENLQRENLNALEEAAGFQALIDDHAFTQDDVARRLGKSRSAVANTLRLLSLPDPVKAMLADRRLSAGHARALLSAPPAARIALAERTVNEGLSVRTLERLTGAVATPQAEKAAPKLRALSPDEHAFESRLRQRFGTHVSIVRSGRGGRIELRFGSDDELIRLGDLLLGEE